MVSSRFVVQEHRRGQEVHWDLMLEDGECLATWQVGQPVGEWDACGVECVRIFDHRLVYLSYEGAISGGRGEVRIVCGGAYEVVVKEEKHWRVRLMGDMIGGELELEWLSEDCWRLRLFHGEQSDG